MVINRIRQFRFTKGNGVELNNKMVNLICGKCNTKQDMTKRIICEGTSKECFCWWCPNCKDQISDGCTHKETESN